MQFCVTVFKYNISIINCLTSFYKKYILIILLVYLIKPAFAQERKILFDKLTVENGLSQSGVISIAQANTIQDFQTQCFADLQGALNNNQVAELCQRATPYTSKCFIRTQNLIGVD